MSNQNTDEERGEMTVEEAGHKGGQKVKELVKKGEEEEAQEEGDGEEGTKEGTTGDGSSEEEEE
ncbi:TPA: hypothetical protein DD449_02925 [Candidatus Berkelbacteria bacterium]|uniref:Uncharacterized protein n=1 Tax=Berkelbacteria bacterium GW2011_GWE1_39_12 TaxID=1618337 RepID=A0A0G4B218_9BACT|nr:MAG: hypothetical protein UT28_C0001G0185 [Berkelbacteria bacterium GW2011_GWE1_39_12]HBO60611.1 hypothetical protein [Candidatus Berkelbacteria bacterium]